MELLATIIGVILVVAGFYLTFVVGTTGAIIFGIVCMVVGFAMSGALLFTFDGDWI